MGYLRINCARVGVPDPATRDAIEGLEPVRHCVSRPSIGSAHVPLNVKLDASRPLVL
jgi:hypothetical protein